MPPLYKEAWHHQLLTSCAVVLWHWQREPSSLVSLASQGNQRHNVTAAQRVAWLLVARCMLPEAAATAIPHVRERVKHGWPHRGRQCPGCAAVCRPLAGRNIVVSRTGQVGRCSKFEQMGAAHSSSGGLHIPFASLVQSSCILRPSSCLPLDMLAILLPCLAIILPAPELEQLVWDRGAPFSCFLSTGHAVSWHHGSCAGTALQLL
jgi:hypothetical protein